MHGYPSHCNLQLVYCTRVSDFEICFVLYYDCSLECSFDKHIFPRKISGKNPKIAKISQKMSVVFYSRRKEASKIIFLTNSDFISILFLAILELCKGDRVMGLILHQNYCYVKNARKLMVHTKTIFAITALNDKKRYEKMFTHSGRNNEKPFCSVFHIGIVSASSGCFSSCSQICC